MQLQLCTHFATADVLMVTSYIAECHLMQCSSEHRFISAKIMHLPHHRVDLQVLRRYTCHIIELIAKSASTSVSWNQRAPSVHEIPWNSTRKDAQTILTWSKRARLMGALTFNLEREQIKILALHALRDIPSIQPSTNDSLHKIPHTRCRTQDAALKMPHIRCRTRELQQHAQHNSHEEKAHRLMHPSGRI